MRAPEEFAILRDRRYHQVVARDAQRQVLRRGVHRLAGLYERLVWHRRWQDIALIPEQGRRQKLSTCIITMNAESRIRPLLEYIRPFSDEIVVGVDSKTTDNTFQACEGLADELFTIENDAPTCNGGLEALVKRCHGDWVLRLDDDEFPEPAFARFKDGLLSSELFTHYKLPRLHLSSVERDPLEISGPAPYHLSWIRDGYLYPDFQLRLFRNDPALLSFPGPVGHGSIQCEGRRGKLNSVHLVHLNLAMNPRFAREQKLDRYIARHNGGWVHPVNELALLFENFKYKIEPYRYPDEAFITLISEITLHQRELLQAQQPEEDLQNMGTLGDPTSLLS
ncbi:MAG: glycosyltransferase [Vampirovibrionales bacterium]|nr:glycosyltransferase [Vampirovibrionales bacterium]